jgi:hypothetical protein
MQNPNEKYLAATKSPGELCLFFLYVPETEHLILWDSDDMEFGSTPSVAACICISAFYTLHDIDSVLTYAQIHVATRHRKHHAVWSSNHTWKLELFLVSLDAS